MPKKNRGTIVTTHLARSDGLSFEGPARNLRSSFKKSLTNVQGRPAAGLSRSKMPHVQETITNTSSRSLSLPLSTPKRRGKGARTPNNPKNNTRRKPKRASGEEKKKRHTRNKNHHTKMRFLPYFTHGKPTNLGSRAQQPQSRTALDRRNG